MSLHTARALVVIFNTGVCLAAADAPSFGTSSVGAFASAAFIMAAIATCEFDSSSVRFWEMDAIGPDT